VKTILTVLLLMVVDPIPSISQSLTPVSIYLGGGPTSLSPYPFYEHWKSAFNVGLGVDYHVLNLMAIGVDFTVNHATFKEYYYSKLYRADFPTIGPNFTMFSLSAAATFLILSRDRLVHPFFGIGCGLFRRQPGPVNIPQGGYFEIDRQEQITRIEYYLSIGVEVRVYKSLAAFVKAKATTQEPMLLFPFTIGTRIGL